MAFNPLRAVNPYGSIPGAGGAYASPAEPELKGPTIDEVRESAVCSLAYSLISQGGVTARKAWDEAADFWRIAFERAGELKSSEEAS